MGQSYLIAGTAKSDFSISVQFKELVDSLSERGFTSVDNFPANFLISVNHNPSAYREFIENGGDPKNTVLLMLEPRVVYPSQYTSRILKRYALVLAPGNVNFFNTSTGFIYWPYEALENPQTPDEQVSSSEVFYRGNVDKSLFDYQNWVGREFFLTMINANKVSPVKEENYSLRRKFARVLDSGDFAVFGDYWDSSLLSKVWLRIATLAFSIKSLYPPNLRHVYGNLHWRFPSSRGVISDKQIVLAASKFSLVIENDDSYVSEKIFDALVNGCIPVYFGPRLSSSILPSPLLIRYQGRPSELTSFLKELTASEIQEYLREMLNYISSDSFGSKWNKKSVYNECAAAISSHFGVTDE
jgi:hypothetical protein